MVRVLFADMNGAPGATTTRRGVLGGALTAGGAALLAACGGTPPAANQPRSTANRGQLVYQSWADLSRPDVQGYWNWVAQEYAGRFPGASFKHEIVDFDQYPQKFTIMAAAGTVPE